MRPSRLRKRGLPRATPSRAWRHPAVVGGIAHAVLGAPIVVLVLAAMEPSARAASPWLAPALIAVYTVVTGGVMTVCVLSRAMRMPGPTAETEASR